MTPHCALNGERRDMIACTFIVCQVFLTMPHPGMKCQYLGPLINVLIMRTSEENLKQVYFPLFIVSMYPAATDSCLTCTTCTAIWDRIRKEDERSQGLSTISYQHNPSSLSSFGHTEWQHTQTHTAKNL